MDVHRDQRSEARAADDLGQKSAFALVALDEGHARGKGVGGATGDEGLRYGVQSMELLVNALLRRGARRERLEVKLFGGAHLFDGLSDVGSGNARFVRQFLDVESIPILSESLGGIAARRTIPVCSPKST